MTTYFVRAKPHTGTLKNLRKKLDSGEILKMNPFGRALDSSLRNAKINEEGYALWEEQDYCSLPLAMERKAVLDQHFQNIEVELTQEGRGWERVRGNLSLWIVGLGLPTRSGDPPVTSSGMPHTQMTQNAPVRMYKKLAEKMFELSDIEERPSVISVPGARAMWLKENVEAASAGAFFGGREFAHIHPPNDGSLHLSLPRKWVKDVVGRGWGDPHPMARMSGSAENILLVYGPRNEDELDIVYNIVLASYKYAKNQLI